MWCETKREDDGTYTARIVEADIEASGDTASEAIDNLYCRVLFELRM